MKLQIRFPSEAEMLAIALRTTTGEQAPVRKVADGAALISAGHAIRQMPVAETVAQYAVRFVFSTHPDFQFAGAHIKRYVRFGASPRAAQSLLLVAKFFALLDGRMNVSIEDIDRAAFPCLRHRIIRNFDAIADDVSTDDVIAEVRRGLHGANGRK
jgi:MoxR-like ATPase